MKIGLFGGSFNPPHLGHRAFARTFKELGQLDQVWILVSPEPPHKESLSLADYRHRLEMARINFESLEGIVINRSEERLPSPHFTVNTIKELQESYPNHTFFLCLGEDSIRNFDTWKSPDDILSMVEILVVKRESSSEKLPDSVLSNLDRVHWLESDVMPISSSQIRDKLHRGLDVSEYIDSQVLEYIRMNRLYIS
jgi:nicotinate-nucleotide adenylyltransferase